MCPPTSHALTPKALEVPPDFVKDNPIYLKNHLFVLVEVVLGMISIGTLPAGTSSRLLQPLLEGLCLIRLAGKGGVLSQSLELLQARD